MEVSKETHVMFQDERVGNVYMLQNSEVINGELQLSSALKVVVVKQLYPEGRSGLGAQ